MDILTCKSCGGDLRREGNVNVCLYCGNKWFIDADNDVHVFDRANAWTALREGDFDLAMDRFNYILEREPKDFEAYWGRGLANAGILYVTDLDEHKRVPTCNNISERSFLESDDVQKAIKLAPQDLADSYREQAKRIDDIRVEWLKKASREEEYDVFICFKDSDREHGLDRTVDSFDAHELYNSLTNAGYRVFFSRVSLRHKVSEHYEPYIYNALKTAKVMIVFGEKPEYFNAVWVKNEWSRFITRIEQHEKDPRSLVVAYKNMDPGDLPVSLRSRQCMDAGSLNFFEDLKEHIEKLVHPNGTENENGSAVGSATTGGQSAGKRKKPKSKARPWIVGIFSVIAVACIAALIGLFIYAPTESDGASGVSLYIPNTSVSLFDKLSLSMSVDEHSTDSSDYIDAKNALRYETEKFKLYDISLKTRNNETKILGDITVVVPIPEGFQASALKVYYVASDEEYVEIPSTVSVAANTITFKTNHFSLYAIAERHPIVSFDSNGGTAVDRQIVERDKYAAKPKDPTREDCIFVGWEYDGALWDFQTQTVKKDITLKARWRLPVKFNANGGTGTVDTVMILFGESKVLPLVSGKLTREGYIFNGWSTTPKGAVEYKDGGTYTAKVDAPVTLYAQWRKERLNISFDPNGGVEAGAMPTETYESGISFNLPENLFTRDGYTFLGWSTKANSVIVEYSDRGRYTVGDEDCTLYAVWKATENSLNFHANGGDGYMEELLLATDQTMNLPLCSFQRDGYRFAGWSTSLNGELAYAEGAAYTMKPNGEVLYAVWIPNQNTIVFHANGGTGTMESISVATGESITLPKHTFAREGYIFRGWGLSSDSGRDYADNEAFTMDATPVINLYAIWEEAYYTLTYETNGGSWCSDKSFYWNENNFELATTTREGYTFVGWYTTNDFSGEPVETLTLGDEPRITLYAKWSPLSYTVTFDPNGGAMDETQMTVVFGTNVTLPIPVWAGHTFEGWAREDYYWNTVENSFVWEFPQDMAFKASWSTAIYSIEYELNGGYEYGNPTTYTMDDAFALLAPHRDGYTFTGWTYEGQEEPVLEVTVALGSEGNKKFTANWVANTYTLTLNYGNYTENETMTVTYDTEYTLPTPTREGYTFDAWYIWGSPCSGGIWNFAEDREFVANWIPRTDVTYTVNYYLQNANDDGYTLDTTLNLQGEPDEYVFPEVNDYDHFISPDRQSAYILADGSLVIDYYYDRETFKLSMVNNNGQATNEQIFKYEQTLVIADPIREGSVFGGWFTDMDLTEPYSITDTLTEDITIYAYWEGELKPGDFTYDLYDYGNVEYDYAVINSYPGDDAVVKIPAYIGGIRVTSIYEYAFHNREAITELWIPETVKTIGNYAFSGCVSVVKVNSETDGELLVPSGVETIGQYAFANFSLITKVVVPDNVKTIRNYAFFGCSAIEEITLPFVGATATETYYYNMMFGCIFGMGTIEAGDVLQNNDCFSIPQTIKKVTITLQTEIPNYAFQNCWFIETITIPQNVTSIGTSAFHGCSSLKKLNSESEGIFVLPEAINQLKLFVFAGCTGLTEISIPESVEKIGADAFSGCSSIVKVNSETEGELIIPSGVIAIEQHAFASLNLITKVVVPENVILIESGAFNGFTSLKEITIPFVGKTEAETTERMAVFGYIFGDTNTSDNSMDYSSTDYLTSGEDGFTSQAGYSGSSRYYYLIPQSLRTVTVTKQTQIPAYAFRNCDLIETIYLPDTVQSMGKKCFQNCSALKRLNSETDGVFNLSEDLLAINDYAFHNCKCLTEITIPAAVETIGEYAFGGCSSVSKVNSETEGVLTFPAGVTSVGRHAFDSLVLITKVIVPEHVAQIQNYAFNGCTAIEEITLPYVGASMTESYSYNMVFGCIFGTGTKDAGDVYQYGNYYSIPKSIKKVTITAQTKIPNYAFQNCSFLESITIPATTENIASYAFQNCSGVTNLQIPASVQTIGSYAFDGCTAAIQINGGEKNVLTVPSGVTYIGEYAFRGLDEITEIIVPNSVTSMGGGLFEGCTSVEKITLPFTNRSATDTYRFGILFKSNGYNTELPPSLEKVTITKQTEIPAHAFYEASYIKEIRLPEETTYIGEQAFYRCIALVRLNSDADGVCNIPKNVTEIDTSAFFDCKMLTEVNLSENLQTIGNYAFNGCISIEKINSKTEGGLNIPNGVISIGRGAFNGLALITQANIPDSVTSMGAAVFENCSTLTELTIPFVGRSETETSYGLGILFKDSGSNQYVPVTLTKVTVTKQTKIQNNAFKECKFIEEVNLPENTTNIGSYAFYKCIALVRMNSDTDGVVNIPADVTAILDYTFYDCALIEKVFMGDAVTSIGQYAFSGCTSIEQINGTNEGDLVIPDGVMTIGEKAFYNLSLIQKVFVPDSVSLIGKGAFQECTAIEEMVLPFVGRKVGETEALYTVFGSIFGTGSNGTVQNYVGNSTKYCIPTTIKKVTITAQTVIPEYAFRNCSFIEEIILPAKGTVVGDYTFENCPATVSYTYENTTSIWNGTDVSTTFIGSGTEGDPYQINQAADFVYLRDMVNAGESYAGKYFVLNSNLHLNRIDWQPIGTKDKPFAGVFDGNGMKVTNLYITKNVAYLGLFGYVSGTVKNLGIASGEINLTSNDSARVYVGSLVGYLTGSVENCYSQISVYSGLRNTVYAGGLVGLIDTTGSVKNSYASGHVTVISSDAFAYAGGLVGSNQGVIEKCLAFGDVSSKGSTEIYSKNGGLVGENKGTVTDCYRSESQVFVRYGVVDSVSCTEGTQASVADMIEYAKENWDKAVWGFDMKYPYFNF